MKEKYIFFTLFLCIFLLVTCGPDQKSQPYSKEFPYLPSYHGQMELIEFEDKGTGEMSIATYSVPSITGHEFLMEYETLLLKEGWVNTFDNKPVSINMEKEDHLAIIITPPAKEGENLIVIIYSQ